jgi:hypothetical protein
MPGYTLDAVGTNASNIAGGILTPGLPAFTPGKLFLMRTGANSITLGVPTIPGWLLLSPNLNAKCASLYGRIAQVGDAAPTFQWDGTHQSYASIAAFGGDVYNDITTIVLGTPIDRGANTQGDLSVNGIAIPSLDSSMVVRGGHCVKSATNNGASYLDWTTNPGILTKIGTDIVQNGTALASTWWFWQQTTATGLSADNDSLTNTEAASANSQGWTIVLQTAAQTMPVGEGYSPDTLPRRSAQSAVQQFWSVPDTITSIPPATPPPYDYEYPNPRRRPMPLSAFDMPTNQLPLGTDRVLVAAQWDYEWDKPSLPVAIRAECTGLNANLLYALNNFPPYQEFNWPVPPQRRQPRLEYTQNTPLVLNGQGVKPFFNLNLDPPRGTRKPIENLSCLSSGLSLQFFIQPKPIGGLLFDSPPRAARRPVQDYVVGVPLTVLSYLTTFPLVQPELAQPRLARRRPTDLSFEDYMFPLIPPPSLAPAPNGMFDLPSRYRIRSLRALTDLPFNLAILSDVIPPPGPGRGSGRGPAERIILMPKKQGESVIRTFDFVSKLAPNETITGAKVTAFVYSGTDGSPQSIVSGSSSVVGTQVNQMITAGNLGVIYELLCKITTSLNQVLEMSAFWTVEPDLP